MRHVVMFSGGIASWAAARRIADAHGTTGMTLLFADTRAEDEDLYRFLTQAAAQIGAPLVRVADSRAPWQVFADETYIGNACLAPCSRWLKQVPCCRWLEAHTDPADTVVHVGIDWTELHRPPAIRCAYRPWRAEAPLCEPPYLSKDDLLNQARRCGLEPPRLYRLGFPHNNCGGACVRAGQATWAHLLQTFPDRYRYHEHQEERLRTRLGKNVAILWDRTGGTTRPLALQALRRWLERRTAADEHDALDWGGCLPIPETDAPTASTDIAGASPDADEESATRSAAARAAVSHGDDEVGA